MTQPDSHSFSVAGLVVHVMPELCSAVSATLADYPGVEVHQKDASGKLVVTIEEAAQEKDAGRRHQPY